MKEEYSERGNIEYSKSSHKQTKLKSCFTKQQRTGFCVIIQHSCHINFFPQFMYFPNKKNTTKCMFNKKSLFFFFIYFFSVRFLYRDLATRNCIVSSDFIVKVSYPGLCKDKYSREYFKHRNSLLPVRWLAPECIQEDEYTTKSDIFAYGVMVWELFTQSTKLPFEELTNEEFVRKHQNYQIDWECAPKTPEDLQDILVGGFLIFFLALEK